MSWRSGALGAAGPAALAGALLWGCAGAAPVTRGARLVLRCLDPQAAVSVDGQPMGRAGDFDGKAGRLHLKPGPHRVELRGSSGAAAVREVVLGPGDEVALTVSLPAP